MKRANNAAIVRTDEIVETKQQLRAYHETYEPEMAKRSAAIYH